MKHESNNKYILITIIVLKFNYEEKIKHTIIITKINLFILIDATHVHTRHNMMSGSRSRHLIVWFRVTKRPE